MDKGTNVKTISYVVVSGLVILGLAGCGSNTQSMSYHTMQWYVKHHKTAKAVVAKCNKMSNPVGAVLNNCANAGDSIPQYSTEKALKSGNPYNG